MNSTTMAAQDVGAAWLEYVAATLMLTPDQVGESVTAEYARLQAEDEFSQYRELWRDHTDKLIIQILETPTEGRARLLEGTDPKSLAYVQERIHAGTDLITTLVRKGLTIEGLGDEAALLCFFRQILLQTPEQQPAPASPEQQAGAADA